MDGWPASKLAPLPVYIVLAGEEGGMSPSRYKEKICQRTDELLASQWPPYKHHTICHLHISHNAPRLPPCPPPPKKKMCMRIVFNFSWDHYNAQEKLKAKVIGGGEVVANKVQTNCNTMVNECSLAFLYGNFPRKWKTLNYRHCKMQTCSANQKDILTARAAWWWCWSTIITNE